MMFMRNKGEKNMNEPTAVRPKRGLPTPQFIVDAIEQSEGRPLIIELLCFVLVFLVGGIVLEGLLTIIGIAVVMLSDPGFVSMVGSGNAPSADLIEVTERLAANPAISVVGLFSTIGMIVGVFIYCRLIEKRRLPTLGFTKKGFASEYLTGLAVGTLMFSVGVAISFLAGTLRFDGFSAAFAPGWLAVFLLGYGFQGMSEEVLCRSYFMVSLARRQAVAVAMIVSAAAFAAMHFANPNTSVLAFVNLFLFGVFAAAYFIKRGDIWGVAAIHTSWNFVQGNVFGIAVSGTASPVTVMTFAPVVGGDLVSGGAFGLEGGLAVTAVLVLSTAVTLLLPSRKAAAPPTSQAGMAQAPIPAQMEMLPPTGQPVTPGQPMTPGQPPQQGQPMQQGQPPQPLPPTPPTQAPPTSPGSQG
jgi:membrane protease YdiL (CAAX protease family)